MRTMVMKTAGLFDPPQKFLDTELFTSDFKLKPKARVYILKRLKDVVSIKPIKFIGVMLMGSLTTFQYNQGSDMDIQTQLAPEHDDDFDTIHELYRHTNGHLFPNTQHAINFFPVPSTAIFRPENLTGGYDLIHDCWIRFPVYPSYADIHRYDIDKPLFDLETAQMALQLEQAHKRPADKQEAIDVAEQFHELDVGRKNDFDYPGMQGGTKSIGNAIYKIIEKRFGEKPEQVYQKLKKYLLLPPKLPKIKDEPNV